MAKKRHRAAGSDQLAFDFAFQEAVDTIELLEHELTTDDDGASIHASAPTPAAVNRGQDTHPADDPNDQKASRIPPSSVEDIGSLGVQQPRIVGPAGGPGGDRPDESFAGPASSRAPSADGLDPSPAERHDGARNLGDVRDPHRAVGPNDYIISAADQLGEGGAKAKFRANISALQTLMQLRDENRHATADEQAVLVRYVGWGGLPQAFDPRNADWTKEYAQLVQLLGPEEYERARRSTQDAHYTSETVIAGIYEGLERAGFRGGRILEPSSGIGNFVGLMPEPMRSASAVTAIELDPLTSEIARHLYPSVSHINKGFQDVAIPQGYFDAVIGNPPFGNQSLYDPHHRDLSSLSIHNYFIAKSLDKLRPGGVMGVVVSRYFMDSANPTARELIADQAEFLCAVRLPNNAFKRNALTEVTTDIVFFQKLEAGTQATERKWLDVGEVRDRESGEAITINRYFAENPQQIIGEMALQHRMHRDGADCIAPPGTDLHTAITTRLASIAPRYSASHAEVPPQDLKPALSLDSHLKIGSLFVTPDRQIARRLPDLLDQPDYQIVVPKNERAAARIMGMIEVRNALTELMRAEQSPTASDADIDRARLTLNHVYDRFVSRHGHVSSQANKLVMAEDPEYPLLNALESNYDKGISRDVARKHGVEARPPSAEKAAIFVKRVMSPRVSVERVDTAKEALVVSMNEAGRVDLGRMMRLTSKSEADLVAELQGLIYFNPQGQRWETADQYLTGNVKRKLQEAEAAAEHNPSLNANVEALRSVQPQDIEPVDISVQLGSSWVPGRYVEDFIRHTLGDVTQSVSYQQALGKWLVKISGGDHTTNSVTWGTDSYRAPDLIEAILINRPIQVKVEIGRDEQNRPIYKIDDAKTAAANQKADEIKQAFLDWVWEDKSRREHLGDIYNSRFNTNVPARYDGSHLELPGASVGINLRPNQKDGIWRGIQDGTALFDHVVGAGKTYTCIGTIMESKRMGLMNKPMLVVPNHLLLQWKDAFYSLYPHANVLVAEKTDFKKENRERLFGRIATGDWDAVVVAHSSFKRIGMPAETLNEILSEQISDLTRAISELKAERGDRVTIKEMEKAKERMKERLERKADTGAKDKAVDFSQLGVDALFVDEAQEFKNLFITTSLSRISGLGNLSGSEKAFDLFVKCRYLQKNNDGRGVFFATGTPLSNTIAELYTMQRYLQYDELKARGIVHFDAWASTFGQVVTGWELDATGVNYKLNSRFSKFQNVPELTSMYRTFADVITKADLDRQAEERGTRFPVPKMKDGKPQNIIVDRTEAQATYMGVQTLVSDNQGQPVIRPDGMPIRQWNAGSIIHRMENLPDDPRIDNPLKITNDARKAGLDFRLIDPGAADEPQTKINVAIENILRLYHQWSSDRGTQLVFCDLSTPKAKKQTAPIGGAYVEDAEDVPALSMDEILAGSAKFSVYDDIKAKLLARGIPENEVRFIHDATTDLQKSKLFDEMNRGDARILLGSTAKMGAGTNVQRRLVALHHLDAPWRPSDLEQREGRILRQGNALYERDPDHFQIEVLRYATKQTYDSRMWQTIEYKAAGIEQFRKGDSLQRVIEDVAGEAANAAEMKAAATGNPLIFMQVQLSSDLKKLEALYSNHKRNLHSLERRIEWLSSADERADKAVQRWTKEIGRRDAAATGDFKFVAGERPYGSDDKPALVNKIAAAMKEAHQMKTTSPWEAPRLVDVGEYRGFKVQVSVHLDIARFTVFGHDSYEPDNMRYSKDDAFSLNGFINRMDNFLDKFEAWRDGAEHGRHREKEELQKAVAEKAKPFSQQERLEALRQDVRDVMAELKIMQGDPEYVSIWKPKSQQQNDQIRQRTKAAG